MTWQRHDRKFQNWVAISRDRPGAFEFDTLDTSQDEATVVIQHAFVQLRDGVPQKTLNQDFLMTMMFSDGAPDLDDDFVKQYG